jgi:cell wall integrity and stress response component
LKSNVPIADGSSSTTTSSATTSTTAGVTVITQAGQTIVVTASSDPSATAKSSGGGTSTAGIAAGVVVGVIALAAIIGAAVFFLRRRQKQRVEEEYRRNAEISAFTQKKPSSMSSDARWDSDFMAQRRQSNGSIADAGDFSRRILQVSVARPVLRGYETDAIDLGHQPRSLNAISPPISAFLSYDFIMSPPKQS